MTAVKRINVYFDGAGAVTSIVIPNEKKCPPNTRIFVVYEDGTGSIQPLTISQTAYIDRNADGELDKMEIPCKGITSKVSTLDKTMFRNLSLKINSLFKTTIDELDESEFSCSKKSSAIDCSADAVKISAKLENKNGRQSKPVTKLVKSSTSPVAVAVVDTSTDNNELPIDYVDIVANIDGFGLLYFFGYPLALIPDIKEKISSAI